MRCKNDGLFLSRSSRREKTYGQDYYGNDPNKFNGQYFLNKLASIKHLIATDKPKILDVGCGWGDFEEVLEKEKFPYLGIDINREAVDICRKRGLNCKLSTIQQFNNTTVEQFAAVTMFQVIEHLKDPLSTLKSAGKLLKKGGFLLITTPDNGSPLRKIMGSRWSVYAEPSHYVFFNKETLGKTLRLAGFRNIRIRSDSPRFLTLDYIFRRLNLPLAPPFSSRIPIPTDPFGDLEAVAFLD